MAEKTKINVKWTGKYPCLCSGEWVFNIKGVKISIETLKEKGVLKKEFEELLTEEMETLKEYSFWSFTEDWDVNWTTKEKGLPFEKWIKFDKKKVLEKIFKIFNIELSFEEWAILYNEINCEDWQHGTCGGCI